jgi:hypothetical protein
MRRSEVSAGKLARLLGILALGLVASGSISWISRAMATPPEPQEHPYLLDSYYKARWGYADEFIRLFKRNHLPVLKMLAEEGRILKISAVKPRYHGTEDGRWDYRVTLVFKNATAATDSAYEESVKKQIFPDQETFQRDEQRRFEILTSHWDLPIVDVALEQ